MDKNHQDKIGSQPTASEIKLWLPPLSPKDQEKLKQLQNNRLKDTIKRLKEGGYKVTEEYNDTGQLSKISREFPAKKTRWDWAQLLIVPLFLALLGFVFTGSQYLASLQIAKDTQEEATLKAYLDDMTALLLDKKLGSQAPADKLASANAAVVARAKTLTALRRLTDAQRKARVLQFLYEAHLIGYLASTNPPSLTTPIGSIINLDGADLSRANLSKADLRVANLSEADLNMADLSEADLRGANLRWAKLIRAKLSGAYLSEAKLSGAYLSEAKLSGADLSGSDLRGANLSRANLSLAFLREADLRWAKLISGADLSFADLSFADLSFADLSFADLKDATGITMEKLEKQAKSLKGATMPDGSKHP